MRKALLIGLLAVLVGISFTQGLDNLAPRRGSDIGLKQVGLRSGLVIPYARYSPGIGVGLVADLGDLMPVLGLELEMDYVKAEEKDPRTGISPIIFTLVGGGIKGVFRPEVEWEVKPYAAAGLGVDVIFRKHPRETADEDDTEPRYFSPRLELGANYVLNEEFTAFFSARTVLSNPSFATVMIGIKYRL